jgi:hypothetical protein
VTRYERKLRRAPDIPNTPKNKETSSRRILVTRSDRRDRPLRKRLEDAGLMGS